MVASLISIIIWIFSLGTMTPKLFMYQVEHVFNITGCVRIVDHYVKQMDTALTFTMLYLLPLCIVLLSIMRICYRRCSTDSDQVSGNDSNKFLTIACFIYAIGWFPSHLYHLSFDFAHGAIPLRGIFDRGTIVLLFSFGANALCPIFYWLASDMFRQNIRRLYTSDRSPIETLCDESSEDSAKCQDCKQKIPLV